MKGTIKATGEEINVEKVCDDNNGSFYYSATDIDDDRSWEPHEIVVEYPTEVVIEGWATIDFPGDEVVIHENEPYKWKFQPEGKDEYWVSRGTKYNFVDSLFPSLTPEKPQKVRVTITQME